MKSLAGSCGEAFDPRVVEGHASASASLLFRRFALDQGGHEVNGE